MTTVFSPAPSPPVPARELALRLGARAGWLPWALFAALSARLAWRTSRLAVELPFWDQWDFWTPLFDGSGPWAFFRWQHGPQRQGLGGLVLWASGRASGMSVRAEAFVSAGFVVAGAALGLLLARRVRGRLDALDAVLPLILLTGLHADPLVVTPNPAHGPVSFFLLLAAPLCFAIPRAAVRLPLVVALAVAAIYTGFDFLLAPLLLALQAVDLWRAPPAVRRWHALALAASAILSSTFFVGYQPMSAVDCYRFPDPEPLRYAPFAAAVMARPWGIPGFRGWRVALAIPLALPLVAAAAWGARRTLARGADELARAAFLLCGTAVAFAAATAVGRVCLGIDAAAAPRYVPYELPGIAAGYLVLRERVPRGRLRSAALALVALAALGKEALVDLRPVKETLRIVDGKRRFLDCLRRGGDGSRCARETRFAIHPDPEATRLEEKLGFLRERRLGPFGEP